MPSRVVIAVLMASVFVVFTGMDMYSQSIKLQRGTDRWAASLDTNRTAVGLVCPRGSPDCLAAMCGGAWALPAYLSIQEEAIVKLQQFAFCWGMCAFAPPRPLSPSAACVPPAVLQPANCRRAQVVPCRARRGHVFRQLGQSSMQPATCAALMTLLRCECLLPFTAETASVCRSQWPFASQAASSICTASGAWAAACMPFAGWHVR